MKHLLIILFVSLSLKAVCQNSITLTPTQVDIGKPNSSNTISNQTSTFLNGEVSFRLIHLAPNIASITSLDRGDATIISISPQVNTVIHSITSPERGTLLILFNNSTNRTITLKSNSTTGTIDERFLTPNDADIVLSLGDSVILVGTKDGNFWNVVSWTK